MELWGFKTEALFDVWSIEHLACGVSLAWTVKIVIDRFVKDGATQTAKLRMSFLLVLVIALLWENVEHYVEKGLLGERIAFWFQGVEHWGNRLFTDNLMVMLGWFIFNKKNKSVWFARVFSTAWLMVHIFVFPHSMYLHTLKFN
jgi:hypothetical protein